MSTHNTGKVTVMVPVYGVERYIGRCAESLFSQRYADMEFVFVDDCTPDASVAVLEETLARYPQRAAQTRIVHHEHNRGLSAARNTALDTATGQYLMIVDSDDWLVDDSVVDTLVQRMEASGADIVTFDFYNVYGQNRYPSHKNIPSQKEDYLRYVIECRCTPSLATSFYRASVFRDSGVRNIEGMDMCEDYTVQPRLIYYAHKVDYLPQPLYCYYRANESSYLNSYRPPKSRAIPEVEVIERFFLDKPDKADYLPSIEAAYILKTSRMFVNWAKYSADSRVYPQVPRITSPAYLFNRRLMFTYKIVILFQRLHLQRHFAWIVQRKMRRLTGSPNEAAEPINH